MKGLSTMKKAGGMKMSKEINNIVLSAISGFSLINSKRKKLLSINQNGLTFDYVAYKNKMLQVYPDSIIDCRTIFIKHTKDINYR